MDFCGGADCKQRLTNLRFADDVVLFSSSKQSIQRMLTLMKIECEKVGLIMHEGKTKVMHNGVDGNEGTTSVMVENMKIDVLPCNAATAYLGRSLCWTDLHTCEIESRMRKAWGQFHKFKKALTDKSQPLSLRMKLYQATVTPCATYGCASWMDTKENETLIRKTQRSMLRKILGRRWKGEKDDKYETYTEWIQRITYVATRKMKDMQITDCLQCQRRKKMENADQNCHECVFTSS